MKHDVLHVYLVQCTRSLQGINLRYLSTKMTYCSFNASYPSSFAADLHGSTALPDREGCSLDIKNHLGMNQGEGKQGSSTQHNLKTSQLSPTSSIGGTTWNNPSFLNQDVTWNSLIWNFIAKFPFLAAYEAWNAPAPRRMASAWKKKNGRAALCFQLFV